MNIDTYIRQLFAPYDNSPAMEDFKEELSVNLKERIRYMTEKGLTETEAFEKAKTELGDITEIANQICEEKRKEVIGSMYMKTTNYVKPPHAIGYVTSGAVMILGLILMVLMYVRTGILFHMLTLAFPGVLLPVCAFVFLGLTQETATHDPMSRKRAAGYSAAVGLILTGLLLFVILWLRGLLPERSIIAVILLDIPGGIIAALLVLTEKPRTKPWIRERDALTNAKIEESFNDPYTATKFGLFSGSLWIFAAALFFTLGLLISFRISWIVFLFAVAFQLLIQALMMKKDI